MHRARGAMAGVVALAMLTVTRLASADDEPARVPDVRFGGGPELLFGDNGRIHGVLWGSARPIAWLSVGAELAYGWHGYTTTLLTEVESARSWRAVAVARVVLGKPPFEMSAGGMLGVGGSWVAIEGGSRVSSTGAAGGGVVGLHAYPLAELSIDTDLVVLAAPRESGDHEVCAGPRIGLSLHFR